MKKIIKFKKVIVLCSVSFIVVLMPLFFFDIGINSKFHAQNDFNYLFNKRKLGDCDAFKQRVFTDQDLWYIKCNEERRDEENPIRNFKIIGISINKNKAYLQVEIIRDNHELELVLAADGHKLPEEGYVRNYVMTRSRGQWFLDQEI